MTAQTNADSVLTVLNAALPADSIRAYDLDKVPSPRPKRYVEMSLARRFGGNPRSTSQLWTTGYRMTLQAVSQVSIEDVREALQVCRGALEFQRIVVDDQTSTPVQFETEDAPAPDNGAFAGLIALTYVIRD